MNPFLLFLHFFGLMLGAAGGLASGLLMRRAAGMPPEQARTIRGLGPMLAHVSAFGLVLLWVTGLIMVWSKWNGLGQPADPVLGEVRVRRAADARHRRHPHDLRADPRGPRIRRWRAGLRCSGRRPAFPRRSRCCSPRSPSIEPAPPGDGIRSRMRDQTTAPGRKPTQAERIRASLAEAIVRGDLGPGVALDEVTIAREVPGVADPGARGDPPARGDRLCRGAAPPGRRGPAFHAREAQRHVRGDGGDGGALRPLCRRPCHRRRAKRTATPSRGVRGGRPARRRRGVLCPQHQPSTTPSTAPRTTPTWSR